MKKIKFLFFTLLFCFSVPVKADTAFENDDTVLCSFLKENVPENASPIESSLENEYRKTSSKPIDFYFFKRSEKTKSLQMYSPIRKNQIVLCYIRQFSIFKI
jgi:hypothetical protein